MLAFVSQKAERVHIDLALILLGGDARMHSNMRQRHVIEDWNDSLPLLCTIEAEAHLDREIHLIVLLDAISNLLYLVGRSEKSSSSAVPCLQREWASHVDIYLLVAQRDDDVEQGAQFVCSRSNDLWHDIDAFIVFRTDVAHILRAHFAMLQAHERSVISIYSAKYFIMKAAVCVLSISLQWGEKYFLHWWW